MTDEISQPNVSISLKKPEETPKKAPLGEAKEVEFGGALGPDPTRYGDWQHKGRCSDF